MNKSLRCATALLACSLLSSCFTMHLWGFELEDERDPVTGLDDTVYVYDEETEWTWGKFGLRVLCTPLTLALDCVTAPVQAVLLFNDDDC